jgi:hypothetical protein
MGELTIDGQIVLGGSIDNKEIIEVSIDGCAFGFEEVIRTGWKAVTGGSGSVALDLTAANVITLAGVRFRGRSAVTSTEATALGSTKSLGPTTSTTYTCEYPTPPSVPSAPFG